jgi:hypothetical protein
LILDWWFLNELGLPPCGIFPTPSASPNKQNGELSRGESLYNPISQAVHGIASPFPSAVTDLCLPSPSSSRTASPSAAHQSPKFLEPKFSAKNDGLQCYVCRTSRTTVWRRDPERAGVRYCNACGLRAMRERRKARHSISFQSEPSPTRHQFEALTPTSPSLSTGWLAT